MSGNVLQIVWLVFLLFSGTMVAQEPPMPEQNGAEHTAYLDAVNTKDPSAKASKLELFLTEYPDSVERASAMDSLMLEYQTINDVPKAERTAKRILKSDPKNIRALGLLTAICRLQVHFPNDESEVKFRTECKQYAEDGLGAVKAWQKPPGITKDEYLKAKNDLTALFTSTSALTGIVIDTVDPTRLQAAVDQSPNDYSLVYPLAIYYLKAKPPNCNKGFWYLARAVALAPTPKYKKELKNWGQKKLSELRGDAHDWDEAISHAGKSAAPPPGYVIACKGD
jgi:predicted Zn-dependent protease